MLLSLTLDEIRDQLLLKYPQLTSTNATTVQMSMFIQDAINICSLYSDVFANSYLSSILDLSAHFITIGTQGESTTGTVTESGDERNRTKYLSPSVSKLGTYATTKYGLKFENTCKSLGIQIDKPVTYEFSGFIV